VEHLEAAGLRQQYKKLWRQRLPQQQNQLQCKSKRALVCVALAAVAVNFYLMHD
jgi:hypothetical protein